MINEFYRCSCCNQMVRHYSSVWKYWAKKGGISVRICRRCNNHIEMSRLKTVRGFLNSEISNKYLSKFNKG